MLARRRRDLGRGRALEARSRDLRRRARACRRRGAGGGPRRRQLRGGRRGSPRGGDRAAVWLRPRRGARPAPDGTDELSLVCAKRERRPTTGTPGTRRLHSSSRSSRRPWSAWWCFSSGSGVTSRKPRLNNPPPAITDVATALGQDLGFILAAVWLASWRGRPIPAQFGLRRATRRGPPRACSRSSSATSSFLALAAAWSAIAEHERHTRSTSSRISAAHAGTLGRPRRRAGDLVVVAPICEEFLFRGFIFRALRNWRGPWPAACDHRHPVRRRPRPAPRPPSTWCRWPFLGVVLCVIYQRTGSLYPCIAMHVLNNAIALGVDRRLELRGLRAASVAARSPSVAALSPSRQRGLHAASSMDARAGPDRALARARARDRRRRPDERARAPPTTSTPSARSCSPRASPRSASWSPTQARDVGRDRGRRADDGRRPGRLRGARGRLRRARRSSSARKSRRTASRGASRGRCSTRRSLRGRRGRRLDRRLDAGGDRGAARGRPHDLRRDQRARPSDGAAARRSRRRPARRTSR